jgi:RNA recognition motif-containing protein
MPGNQSYKLFIGNVDEKTKVSEIRPLFEKYGKIIECDIVKNYGFVHFENESSAREAISHLNGYVLNGSPLKVENAKSRRNANANTSTIIITIINTVLLLYLFIHLKQEWEMRFFRKKLLNLISSKFRDPKS